MVPSPHVSLNMLALPLALPSKPQGYTCSPARVLCRAARKPPHPLLLDCACTSPHLYPAPHLHRVDRGMEASSLTSI